MEFSIATINDKKNILDYYMELDSESYKIFRLKTASLDIVEEFIRNELIDLFLLYKDNVLVSVIKSSKGNGDGAHSSCLNISTRQKHRNKGYAKKLIKFAIDQLKKDNIKIIRVEIFSWNKPAIATIEKAGFTLSGRIVMSHYDEELGDYIDDLLYHKFL
ncbi:MAG: GNAT family N-acetyltransferase [Acidaminobacteraceae bacterium]